MLDFFGIEQVTKHLQSVLGEWVLSAGLDSSIRAFSTVADLLHRNLGTAHQNQNKARRVGSDKAGSKLPPIVDFSSGEDLNLVLHPP